MLKRERKEKNIFLLLGCCMLLSELWKQWILWRRIGGTPLFLWYIPFQLCSVPMYICLLLGILPERTQPVTSSFLQRLRGALLAFLSDFTLLSGIMAFCDTSGMHYDYAPLTIHSYCWHFLLIGIGIYAGIQRCRGMRQAEMSGVPQCRGTGTPSAFTGAVCIYLICCGIAEILNLSLDSRGLINMFYINPHYPMEQVVFRNLRAIFPNGAVILIYMGATVFGAWLLELLWRYIAEK